MGIAAGGAGIGDDADERVPVGAGAVDGGDHRAPPAGEVLQCGGEPGGAVDEVK